MITVDDPVSDALEQRAGQAVPEARRKMVDEAMKDCLARTIMRNPVDTGRSRAAWQAALDQLNGGTAAGGSDSAAVSEGRRAGQMQGEHDDRTTERRATNGVDYIAFLEYGTSRMAPFSMVRRALSQTLHLVAGFFRLN